MLDWKIPALGSALFAGATGVLIKAGVKDVSPNLAALIRTTVIFAALFLLVTLRGEWRGPLSLPHRGVIFLVLSALTTGASWLCYTHALQRGPASLVAPVDKLSVIFAILLAVVFLGERLTSSQWVGVGFMTLGTWLVAVK